MSETEPAFSPEWAQHFASVWARIVDEVVVTCRASDVLIRSVPGGEGAQGEVLARVDGSMRRCFEVAEPMHLIRWSLRHRPDLLPLCLDRAELPEIDASVTEPGSSGAVQRFRLSASFSNGRLVGSYRPLPAEPPSPASIGLEEKLIEHLVAAGHAQGGLILLAGKTGSGKTTTLAALLEWINQRYPDRIYTIEDPQEFVFTERRSIFQAREVGWDTRDFASGLRTALRNNPDVILIGEMRDLETIQKALEAAETGHLVLATVHAGTVVDAIPRIVRMFPPEEQESARTVLAAKLIALIAQRLLRRAEGGRIAWREILVADGAGVRPTIEHGENLAQLNHYMNTGGQLGMCTYAQHLERIRDVLAPELYQSLRRALA
ncbi:MAG: Flp pilus assembly complex ATPase component TadA [Verrucomicrobia bacterium]|nr:Flp pilus assembly complex ATPase component TadA [Verrucomicrobiota bacterium]